ncbi:MAG: monovalent cation:proton antiporter-2 (CPA2) family protein [Hyphomicrobiaceae bacterium]
MAADGTAGSLTQAVALLGAMVVAVPIFKRLGLGSVLGYLLAGLVIGPFGIGLFSDPQAILHVAEFGVVMLLFVIGLEMEPSRLWALRREIFGLGIAQVGTCGALLTAVGVLFGLAPAVAFVAGLGFVLTSTAAVIQVLSERGDITAPSGRRIISILLLEDLAIVPLLFIVAFIGPAASDEGWQWQSLAIGIGSLLTLLVVGYWLLNPLFRLLASVRAREVMTAAALLVVLGAAMLMELGGLSMAMGAFIAGVLLSRSSFRHQLETDIEPFRDLLLGMFFLSVGMTLDLPLIGSNWTLILALVPAYMAVKAIGIYVIARLFRASHHEGIARAALMAQGGEFAFVLYAAAGSAGILDASTNAVLTAAVIISMALTPLSVLALRWLPAAAQQMDGIDAADGLTGTVLIVGFGRVGQVMSQLLLARGVEVSIIDTDVEMIRSAEEFGFKVYYGDGTRLDVLRHSGAEQARAIAVCVDQRAAADRIVELCKAEFPNASLVVRSFDRQHSHLLIGEGITLQVRETFESALLMGSLALQELGVSPEEAADVVEDIRRRDTERFELEIAGGGLSAGAGLLINNKMRQTPLTPPKRPLKPAEENSQT